MMALRLSIEHMAVSTKYFLKDHVTLKTVMMLKIQLCGITDIKYILKCIQIVSIV